MTHLGNGNGPASHCKRLVIFDFDHTLINCNSDEHVFPLLTGGNPVPYSYNGGSWLGHMNQIFEHLNTQHSIKKEEFCKALATLPFIQGIPELIEKLAAQPGHKLMVLSDANNIFVETALQANKLRKHFSCIMTNHGDFDENGCLRVSPNEEHADRAASGSCPTQDCPENLCKGSEISRLITEFEHFGKPEIWYVGDGWNDWCAACALPSKKHHVFARTGYTLHSIITQQYKGTRKGARRRVNSEAVMKCNASFWHDGHELVQCMAQLDPSLDD